MKAINKSEKHFQKFEVRLHINMLKIYDSLISFVQNGKCERSSTEY